MRIDTGGRTPEEFLPGSTPGPPGDRGSPTGNCTGEPGETPLLFAPADTDPSNRPPPRDAFVRK